MDNQYSPEPPTLEKDQLALLKQHIEQAGQELLNQPEQSDSDISSVIYMGSSHDSYPRNLITDPILKSDEIHAWMLIRMSIKDQYQITRIPKQESLQNQLKLSRPVISRILQVLRATRWITLCSIGSHDQYRGVVYAQHDNPLSLAETLQLDPTYIKFLEVETSGDALKRANTIKDHVLEYTNYRLITDQQVMRFPQ